MKEGQVAVFVASAILISSPYLHDNIVYEKNPSMGRGFIYFVVYCHISFGIALLKTAFTKSLSFSRSTVEKVKPLALVAMLVLLTG